MSRAETGVTLNRVLLLIGLCLAALLGARWQDGENEKWMMARVQHMYSCASIDSLEGDPDDLDGSCKDTGSNALAAAKSAERNRNVAYVVSALAFVGAIASLSLLRKDRRVSSDPQRLSPSDGSSPEPASGAQSSASHHDHHDSRLGSALSATSRPDRDDQSPLVFHLVRSGDWAPVNGFYEPASLEAEGFIHFSTADQLDATAQRYYAGVEDLMVVEVDHAAVADRLKWEPAPAPRQNEFFPHLYAPLSASAVRSVAPYRWPTAPSPT